MTGVDGVGVGSLASVEGVAAAAAAAAFFLLGRCSKSSQHKVDNDRTSMSGLPCECSPLHLPSYPWVRPW